MAIRVPKTTIVAVATAIIGVGGGYYLGLSSTRLGPVRIHAVDLRDLNGNLTIDAYGTSQKPDGGWVDLGGAKCQPSVDGGRVLKSTLAIFDYCSAGDSGMPNVRTHGVDFRLLSDGKFSAEAYGYAVASDGGVLSLPGQRCSIVPKAATDFALAAGLECFLKSKDLSR